MSRTVHVNLDERSYDIHVGSNLPVGAALEGAQSPHVLLITDSNVGPLYAERVEQELQERGLVPHCATVQAGEASKNLHEFGALLEKAVSVGLERGSAVLALGGGVVGDLAGFVASSLFRGVKLVQVPTSLLAMVDSSVGGKTAVNLPQGKNLVGAFYQPVEVTADLNTLQTLPQREYLSGLGEVIKYGIIWDASFFRELEQHVGELLGRDPCFLAEVVARCCEIKAEVVAVDEKESGVRAILNFGHTLAHALEQNAGYGVWLHGEAVAVGMVYAAEVSACAKQFPEEDVIRIRELLAALKLPVVPSMGERAADWASLRDAMAIDKKTSAGIPRFVLAKKLGDVSFGCDVPEDLLLDAYERMKIQV